MGVNNQFHSVLAMNLPATGTVGDVWYTTDERLLYTVCGTGALVQLLVSTPIPVAGPQGVAGVQGPAGEDFIGTVGFLGTWEPSPRTYQAGTVVSFSGFLYMSTTILNVSNNQQNPDGNPFWQILGPSTFSGRTSSLITVIDGAGAVPNTGKKGFVSIPFDCTLTGWVLFAGDQPGSAVFDILWSSYGNFPSTTSIVGASNPQLVNEQRAENLDVSSLWLPTQFSEGDILEIDLISASTATLLNLQLNLTAT